MTLLFEISTITFDTFLLVAFFKKFEMDRCYILYYSCLALDQSKNLRLGNMIFLSHNILTLSTLLITDCSCFKWGYCVLFIVFCFFPEFFMAPGHLATAKTTWLTISPTTLLPYKVNSSSKSLLWFFDPTASILLLLVSWFTRLCIIYA